MSGIESKSLLIKEYLQKKGIEKNEIEINDLIEEVYQLKVTHWIDKYVQYCPTHFKARGFLDRNYALDNLLKGSPQIFESYAIILHPWKINAYQKHRIGTRKGIRTDGTENIYWERISWQEICQLYRVKFDIKKIFRVKVDLNREKKFEKPKKGENINLSSEYPINIQNPVSGQLPIEEMYYIRNEIQNLIGPQVVNVFCSNEDKMYKGSFSDISKLKTVPTLIYPENLDLQDVGSNDWCLLSNKKMDYSFLGGSNQLIENIIQSKNEFEIFNCSELMEMNNDPIDEEVVNRKRKQIPDDVKILVWQRDEGACVKCGSNENLEFDHIIPFSKGGANTFRNLQLLCEPCNRRKSNNIV